MSLFEFFIFTIYLSFLVSMIVAIQVFNLGKIIREQNEETQKVQIMEEPFLDSELEEPESDEKQDAFNPETEEYTMMRSFPEKTAKTETLPKEEEFTMTENPMLRHRNIMEQVD